MPAAPKTALPSTDAAARAAEYLLLGLLALLWGASYLFIKIALSGFTPITLIALRVSGAAAVLGVVLVARRRRMPRDLGTWAALGLQALFNSIGAWTLLAWGEQHVEASLASVLNSTSPIFVFLFTAGITRHESLGGRKLAGAVIGLAGVALIFGLDALGGLGRSLPGQAACLGGAMLYACAAIYGRRFARLGALETALGTMIWASAVLVPLAFLAETPLRLRPGPGALAAAAVLSVFCTGAALLIYFRLVQSLGALGVASQSYLRAGIGVALGVVLLGETPGPAVLAGLLAAILGVALLNARPGRPTNART